MSRVLSLVIHKYSLYSALETHLSNMPSRGEWHVKEFFFKVSSQEVIIYLAFLSFLATNYIASPYKGERYRRWKISQEFFRRAQSSFWKEKWDQTGEWRWGLHLEQVPSRQLCPVSGPEIVFKPIVFSCLLIFLLQMTTVLPCCF